jgi:IS30 family transposase
MGYQRITMEEWEEIFRPRYEDHLFLWEIGQKLHKDKSAVSRELKRGTKNKLYNPTAEANHRRARKRQSPKLKMTDEIWEMTKPKLEKRWSPEQIEEWLKKGHPEYPADDRVVPCAFSYSAVQFSLGSEPRWALNAVGGLKKEGQGKQAL